PCGEPPPGRAHGAATDRTGGVPEDYHPVSARPLSAKHQTTVSGAPRPKPRDARRVGPSRNRVSGRSEVRVLVVVVDRHRPDRGAVQGRGVLASAVEERRPDDLGDVENLL